ncbi:MAG TPA: YraN family protein [Patescibacteria group bacterium]|nr:YraN family protein [Patescibacteria group bacterium]
MRIVNPIAVQGEDIACDYIRGKGYQIIERNFRKKYEEIDIIAVHDNTLVFIEVKTRTSTAYGTPFDGISPYKVRHLVQLAQFYKLTHDGLPDFMRIDAIGIVLSDGKVSSLEHLENISGF